MSLLSLEEAWARIAPLAVPGPAETRRLAEAAGRIAAAEARSAVDLPPFDRSAMDGFALRAQDSGGPLRLAGEVAAGEVAAEALAPGTAVAVTTGAALPPGADAILQSERAAVQNGHVVPDGPVPAGLHVRRRGEDLRAGDVLLRPGERVTLPVVSALASAGVGAVEVHRAPRMSVLVTGSELLPLGAPPEPGKIHESNGLMIRLLAERAGARVHDGGRVPDDAEATREAVTAGLEADVLVVSGGVSVGAHDHVKRAFADCGVEEVLWRVRLKPGKPLWVGRRGATLVFGLPGNPLSTIVGFQVFIEPALRRLQGEAAARPAFVPGRLAAPAQASDGRTTFLTARLALAADGVLEATPTERQGSHMTGALGESDGFVVAPHDAGLLPAGARVDLLPL